MEPGCYDGIPEDDYHASPGLSVSRLKRHRKAPILATVDSEPTGAQRFGTLIHTAILEPHRIEARFAVSDLSRNSKAFKELEAGEEEAGREVIKQAELDNAMRVRDAVMRHAICRHLLAPGLLTEQSFYWNDEETGLLCRGRADGLRAEPEWQTIVDIKSCEDASPHEFARACARYLYSWQDSFYRTGVEAACGWKPLAFIFVAVEKKEPFICQPYELDADSLEAAARQVRDEMRAYAANLKAQEWPGYAAGIETLRLPEWALA